MDPLLNLLFKIQEFHKLSPVCISLYFFWQIVNSRLWTHLLLLSWRWRRRSWERSPWIYTRPRCLRIRFPRPRCPRSPCSTRSRRPCSRERPLTPTAPSWTPSTPPSCRWASATRTPSCLRPSAHAAPAPSTTRTWPGSAWTRPSPSLRPAGRPNPARTRRRRRPATPRWRRPRPTARPQRASTATGCAPQRGGEEARTRRRDEGCRDIWVRPSGSERQPRTSETRSTSRWERGSRLVQRPLEHYSHLCSRYYFSRKLLFHF